MAKSTAKTRKVSITFKDVRQIGFWVGIVLFVFVLHFVTKKAQTTIKTEYDNKTTQFKSEKEAADKVAGNQKHPNKETIEAIAAQKDILAKNVYEAWSLMYKEQKSRNRWPKELSKEFLDIVEHAKFRDPIGVGKPYILEDYAYFMVNNLPELIKNSNRRRYQVRDYQLIINELDPMQNRFEPVYVEPKDGLLYVISGETVYIYNEREEILSKVEESDLRGYLLGLEDRVPHYREMDPMIANPRQFVSGGAGGISSTASASSAPSASAPKLSGGTGGIGNASASMGSSGTNIPGSGMDPAQIQLAGQPQLQGENNEIYPGLPPYQDRSRVVGNIDWLSPEIFKLVNWGSGVPHSIEIWYLQEDLWVYNSVINVLVETNRLKLNKPESEWTEEDKAKVRMAQNNIALSPVKCIEQMLIGQDAASAWSTINGLVIGGSASSSATSGTSSGMSSGMSFNASADSLADKPAMTMGQAGVAGGAGGAPGGKQTEPKELDLLNNILNGRYLGNDDKPLMATEAPPYAEFNKMPVVLKLVVDQRRIPDLLVNCANSPMPIDVRHVRICPDKATGAVGGSTEGSPGGTTGTTSSKAAGSAPGGHAEGGVSVGNVGGGFGVGDYGADAIKIELYGIIYIYNEPNPEQFGTGEAEEQQSEDQEKNSKESEASSAEEKKSEPGEKPETDTQSDNGEEQAPKEASAGESSSETAGDSAEPSAADTAGQAANEPAEQPAEPPVANNTDASENETDSSENETP